ncbi:MAG: hypothetical protein IPK63_11670 [Candidatus Competibacteraceae bacterium]|nr:hypothetical protein [Candidatus Competibacteraceae bacterium]
MPVQTTFEFHAIPAAVLPEASRYLIQSAAWFQGWLYLGICCYPADPHQPGVALLLRHRSRANWELLHTASIESRWIDRNGQYRQFPLELGWRILTVLPGNVQPTPLLYAIRLSLRAPVVLYSEDGSHFQDIPNPGASGGHSPFVDWRGFSAKVFAIPASAATNSGPPSPFAYVAANPLSQDWRPACSAGFGDAENTTLDGLQVAHGQLYAAAGNPLGGFQLWKTSARGEPPFAWELALSEGAQRYTLNPHVETMATFQDALYLGTRSPPPNPEWDFATSGAEIIRMPADGRWELVMGTPRFSPVGLQVPLSTHGPGFGDDRNRRVSQLASTPDALYAALDANESLADATANAKGFALWKSHDGQDWQAITQDSFGCPAATTLRVLQPTSQTLVAAGEWDLTLDPTARPGIWLEKK